MPRGSTKIADRRAAARDDATIGYTDRRLQILDTAARLFKERGFRGTTLTHVAEAMGADRASLYYYVSSKQELFQEVVGEAVRVNLAEAEAIAATDDPAPAKLRALMEGLMASYAEFYPVLYVLIQEDLSHVAPERDEWAREIRDINRAYERVLIEIVQAGQDAGELRVHAPAWVVAYGIMGMLGWSNRWFDPDRSPATAEEIGAAFADTVLCGLEV